MLNRIFLMLVALSAGSTQATSAELPRAAFEAWAKYRGRLNERGFVIEQAGTVNGEPFRSTYRWNADCASFETDSRSLARGGSTAYVRNQNYVFQVIKDMNTPWSLRDLQLGTIAKEASALGILTREEAMPGLLGLIIQGVLLRDALENGLITIECVRETDHQGKRAVELTVRRTNKRQRHFTVDRGTLKLVPDYSWMIVEERLELETNLGTKGTLISERSYRPASDTPEIFNSESMMSDMPYVISHCRSATHSGQATADFDVDLHWNPKVPQESDFRLPHYGLPELAGTNDDWTRRIEFIVIGTVATIALAMLLFRRRALMPPGVSSRGGSR
jgi:hypothetical protein